MLSFFFCQNANRVSHLFFCLFLSLCLFFGLPDLKHTPARETMKLSTLKHVKKKELSAPLTHMDCLFEQTVINRQK